MTRDAGPTHSTSGKRRLAKRKRTTGIGRTGARFPSANTLDAEPDTTGQPPTPADTPLSANPGNTLAGGAGAQPANAQSSNAPIGGATGVWPGNPQANDTFAGAAVDPNARLGEPQPGDPDTGAAAGTGARSGNALTSGAAGAWPGNAHSASGAIGDTAGTSAWLGDAPSGNAPIGDAGTGSWSADVRFANGAFGTATGAGAWLGDAASSNAPIGDANARPWSGNAHSANGAIGDTAGAGAWPGYEQSGDARTSGAADAGAWPQNAQSGNADTDGTQSANALTDGAQSGNAFTGGAQSGNALTGEAAAWPGVAHSGYSSAGHAPPAIPLVGDTAGANAPAGDVPVTDPTAPPPAPAPPSASTSVVEPDLGGVVGPTGARFGPYSARRSRRAKESGAGRASVVPAHGDVAEAAEAADVAPGEPTPEQSAERTIQLVKPWAGALVRPYAHTGGRTRSSHVLALEALISSSEQPGARADAVLTTHHRRLIVELCVRPRSVAEVAALLAVPLGVARVLLGDLATAGAVFVHPTAANTGDGAPDVAFMQRVLVGLRRL